MGYLIRLTWPLPDSSLYFHMVQIGKWDSAHSTNVSSYRKKTIKFDCTLLVYMYCCNSPKEQNVNNKLVQNWIVWLVILFLLLFWLFLVVLVFSLWLLCNKVRRLFWIHTNRSISVGANQWDYLILVHQIFPKHFFSVLVEWQTLEPFTMKVIGKHHTRSYKIQNTNT